jgi:hypothetical protein
MKLNLPLYGLILFIMSFFSGNMKAQKDSVSFDGQLSVWAHVNPSGRLSVNTGARYIPSIKLRLPLHHETAIDFEASVKINGNAGFHPFDSSHITGNIKPYRIWARYATPQLEIRVGLQKINFGSATILRPLMWFDQVDPRDPLHLTDGVWGLLTRYYFLNNANLWLWCLYGNDKNKGWESIRSVRNIPEYGGRMQTPLPKGEMALSFHHRTANDGSLPDSALYPDKVPENRLGFDIKLDIVIGCWFEASWSKFSNNIGLLTNQHLMNLGVDYTFGLGNGLTVVYEQLMASYDQRAFTFHHLSTFSLMSLSYPLGLFNNLSAMVYYDWTNKKSYHFLNFKREFTKFSFYLMVYSNPREYHIPTQNSYDMTYAGTGVQIMAVFNH